MIDVGILGATGLVGQQIAARLDGHPWFRVTWIGASERSAGRRYDEVPWRAEAPRPLALSSLKLERAKPGAIPALLFSALPASEADDLEPALAARGHVVISNARSHRMRADVPLIVPEINPGQLSLVGRQPWPGAIVTNPNCAATVIALALAPLVRFGIGSVAVSTLQALSGAGHPGVPSLDAVANVIPFIDGEEEKIETETCRILDRRFPISAQVTRVPVLHGHMALVSAKLGGGVEETEVREAWSTFRAPAIVRDLPGAPARPIVVHDAPDRPQPRLDAPLGEGMTVSVGRLRRSDVLGWRFVALGHNLIRGAAGGAILNAELAHASGLIDEAGERSHAQAGDIVA
jgi:aspartate-semialdehyde dehydrogenase